MVLARSPHDGDPAPRPRARRAAAPTAARPRPSVEVLPGSYDLPGARLLDLVATMDRLRSPGGCPWDAEQTHESLATYLVEETYETLEAIETGDRDHLREELGDLLLQVVFHARIAAGARRRRRGRSTTSPATSSTSWCGATRTSSGRGGAHDRRRRRGDLGDPQGGREARVRGRRRADGPAGAALAAKLMHRASAHGVSAPAADDDGVGSRLMQLVAEAQAAGLDAEAELRARSQVRRASARSEA